MTDFTDIGLVSLDPLVTFSRRQAAAPIGISGACPELFLGKTSLHLVSFPWDLSPDVASEIAVQIERLSAQLPDARWAFMAVSNYDLMTLSAQGLTAIPGNPAMFVDERVFRPLPPFDFSDAVYDAVYNARFADYKRHELTYRLVRPAFIYDAPFDTTVPTTEAATRQALPDARYLNHEYGKGRHVALDPETVAREINRARCGLCLSEVEGFMRASMEYLLCGVPVVSTQSSGGRDRYYDSTYALCVNPDADAVAAAVAAIGKMRFNKIQIRDHVGQLIRFERRNVLDAVNGLCREVFGKKDVFISLDVFIKANPFSLPIWSRPRFEAAASSIGTTLAPAIEQCGGC
ncbi:MAG: hypothetical protein JOZ55_11695 [Alphaproteobacteria bacterium]|nr:hypothetical protein [Alphaproteobacteria bacterium]